MSYSGNKHAIFTQWVSERGVSIHGVQPAQVPGRGLGIIALNSIKVLDFQRFLEVGIG